MSWNEPGAVIKAPATLGAAAIKVRQISMRLLRSCSRALRVCLVVGAVLADPAKAVCPVRCSA